MMRVSTYFKVHPYYVLPILIAVFSIPSLAEPPHFVNTRHVYERGQACVLEFAAPGASHVVFVVSGFFERTVEVTDGRAVYEPDTRRLCAGDYTVRARVARDGADVETILFPLTISKAHDSERMPVWRVGRRLALRTSATHRYSRRAGPRYGMVPVYDHPRRLTRVYLRAGDQRCLGAVDHTRDGSRRG